LAVLLAGLALPASGAGKNDAAGPLRIPLEPLGYQALVQEFLLAGSSMLTVDFVDNDHLLVTFGVRRLMPRVADDPVDDEDRTVEAVLVALPGKVLARTEWRLHDRSQYLWNLGHGRFLLRRRDQLNVIDPLHAASPEEIFAETPLLHMDRHIVAILVSSDCDLLTLETTKWGGAAQGSGFSADPDPVQISFYRLVDQGPMPGGLLVSAAGTIRTRTAIALPLTTAGRLDVLEGGKNRWLFNFDEHAGKVDELAAWDTSCFPRPTFVGHAEFVAFGCRGGTDKLDLAGFNLKGEEMWQQNFYDSHVSPTFAFAPAAGRFALGRTIVSGDFDPELALPASMVTGQEVRVYQSYDGKQLFKIDLTPVERAGQNFALSPDGMHLAAVRETTVRHRATRDDPAYTEVEAGVEVYDLPPLSAEDKAAVKAAQGMAPADQGARIDVALARTEREDAATEAGSGTAQAEKVVVASGEVPTPAAAEAAQAPEPGRQQADQATVMEGDVPPAGPRKPPSLYSPDEKAQQKPQ
jgi:hypothetical protein